MTKRKLSKQCFSAETCSIQVMAGYLGILALILPQPRQHRTDLMKLGVFGGRNIIVVLVLSNFNFYVCLIYVLYWSDKPRKLTGVLDRDW